MSDPPSNNIGQFLADLQPAMTVFWLGLAVFTVALGVLLYTRWGQYRPLHKCMGLSLLAHLVLACYVATIHIVMPASPPVESVIYVSIDDFDVPADAKLLPPEPEPKKPIVDVKDLLADRPKPRRRVIPVSIRRPSVSKAVVDVPDAYRLRVAADRADVARRRGGTGQTEAAVQAALRWLANNQSPDGRWNAKAHGAGREANISGRDRQGAGGSADNAMTGLALLAMLAGGHTHLDGPYQKNVGRGIDYLVESQADDGNLGGRAATFEFMYCHAMATCALSEAFGMTRDERLRAPVLRAIGYTVRAQDSIGGGWRYRPGDAGDTSQLGWQLMALKSAELAGVPISNTTRQGVARYLQSVASGKHGGRASYRPGESPSRAMSAEAIYCWQLLGLPRQHPAENEAVEYLLDEMPGEGDYNLYYWYYATLCMYQLQDARWQQWNHALQTVLIRRQVRQKGPLAGSWDPNGLWDSYGGRVYSTALATLSLEVYYRFLPLYTNVARANHGVKAR